MTPLQLHCEKWKKGCGTEFCSKPRVKVVIGKGDVPCDVLFIGEAPGMSENVLGVPFSEGAPAGVMLHRIARKSCQGKRIAYTNLVGCIPLTAEGVKDIEPPDLEMVQRCRSRLEEFIRIASPKLIVAVGKESKEYLEQGLKFSVEIPEGVQVVNIMHPSWILRQAIVQQGFEEKKAVVNISSALRRMEEGKRASAEEVYEVDDGTIPF